MLPGSRQDIPLISRPEDGLQRPLVVSVPHSGTVIPQDERPLYGVNPDELALSGDLYVDRLFHHATDFGATLIRTPISRFVVDLNRYHDDVSPISLQGGRVRNEVGYYGHRGVLWSVAINGTPVYKEPLDPQILQRRLDRYYFPYHRALAQELERLRERFGYVLLLDAHSMPSHAATPRGRGAPRADIVPGTLQGRSCSREVTEAVVRFWRLHGRTVALNRPYRGGAITRIHANPQRDIHAFQLEINRGLYMNERSFRIDDGFESLRSQCGLFTAELAALQP